MGTGVLAFGLMSVGVILAARPVSFETPLGGLDKFYRLHRWLGISAFAFATAHWVLRMGPSWVSYFDLFALPARPPRTADTATGFNIFRDLKHSAAQIGEWTSMSSPYWSRSRSGSEFRTSTSSRRTSSCRSSICSSSSTHSFCGPILLVDANRSGARTPFGL